MKFNKSDILVLFLASTMMYRGSMAYICGHNPNLEGCIENLDQIVTQTTYTMVHANSHINNRSHGNWIIKISSLCICPWNIQHLSPKGAVSSLSLFHTSAPSPWSSNKRTNTAWLRYISPSLRPPYMTARIVYWWGFEPQNSRKLPSFSSILDFLQCAKCGYYIRAHSHTRRIILEQEGVLQGH